MSLNNESENNILIGGAWPYANNSLHLGHLAALISGDYLKRYHKLIGDNVVYVSGTDCHGTPITERAKKDNVDPKEIVDKYHEEFTDIFKKLQFSYDIYTRTDDEYHKESVKKLVKRIYDNGYIYSKETLQPFCEKCNIFKSDRELEIICPKCGNVTKGDQCDCGYIPLEEDFIEAVCKECKNKTVLKPNKHLYFALSKFQPEIEKYVKTQEGFWRTISRKETEYFLNEGLKDRAITRDLDWGIELPIRDFEDKRIYVWVEAVLGYITATQKFCEENNLDWKTYWKNSLNLKMYMCHGKDNIVFHSIILPSLLLALGDNLHLPDVMVTTQYLNINEEKISKSKGNAISISEIIDNYSVDSLRYYMLAYGPESKDVNFTIENYIEAHNADIVNKYSNFVNRTLNFKGMNIIKVGKVDEKIKEDITETYAKVSLNIQNLNFRKACETIIDLVEDVNKFYDEKKPWLLYSENEKEFIDVMYTCTVAVANLSNLFEPIMPESSEVIRSYLGINSSWEYIDFNEDIILSNINHLFDRFKIK